MLKKIKIKFIDFWFGFLPGNNYFFKLLSANYDVELSEDPDILIYSCYGREYLKYNCIRLFYTAENVRPDYKACDYAISFDYNENEKHHRMPLFSIYIDQIASVDTLLKKKSHEEALQIWRNKSRFCCMVVSNGQSKKRIEFFEELSKYKKVDSGGLVLNNVGGPVKDKMDFIKDYRFVISFENSSHPGYTTEKIIEPLMADSIPLYWGDPMINNEFNHSCFLNLDESKSVASFIEEIKEIDNNEEKAIAMIMEDKFIANKLPDSINKEKLKLFFDKVIEESAYKIPVAKTWVGKVNFLRVKFQYYKARIKGIIDNL